MGKFVDLTGMKFGRWTVLYRSPDRIDADGKKRVWFRCRCDCGKEADVIAASLRNGKSLSCGCLRIDHIRERHINKTHGQSRTRLHRIWTYMRERCNNPNNPRYFRYGGRGIRVCAEWSGETGFETFMLWAIQNGYSDELTVDRIDNDGDYSPQNCRWVSPKAQSNNRSSGRYITVDGEKKTVAQWSDQLGLKRPGIYKRSDEEIAEIIRKALNR